MKYKFSQVLVIAIGIILSLFANKVQGEGIVETNVTVVGLANGTLRINWSQPLIRSSDGYSVFQADRYVLSWSFENGQHQVLGSNISTTDTNVSISQAYFGATYLLVLYCQMQNVFVTCNNQSYSAYPSCPLNWRQRNGNCYYFNPQKKSWTDSKSTCELMFSGQMPSSPVSDADINEIVQAEQGYWSVMEPCTQLLADDVSTYNCCSSSQDLSQSFMTCPAESIMPFICQVSTLAITAKTANLSLMSLANNSVVVTWDELSGGWSLVWRTITVYSLDGRLLSTTTVSNTLKRAMLPALTPGESYEIKMWPDKDGQLNYETNASFTLLNPRSSSETNGGVLQVPISMKAIVHWEGFVRIQWSSGQVKKDNTVSFNADAYRLTYGLINDDDSNLIEVQITDNLFYDTKDFEANKTYKILLSCMFGRTQFIPCGYLASFNFDAPAKIFFDGKNCKIFDLKKASSWFNAEDTCNKTNGHLVSLHNETEDMNLRSAISSETAFFIGANDCPENNVSNLKWSDGSNWNYSKLPSMAFPDKGCCVASTYPSDTNSLSNWNYVDCNAQLPFICSSTISDLGILQNFQLILTTPTTIRLQWKTSNQMLRVSGYSVEKCNTNTSVCTVVNANVTSLPAYITSLDVNQEYLIRVNASFRNLFNVISVNKTIKTGSQLGMTVNVTSDGRIQLNWPHINPEQKSNVVYVISSDDSATPFKSVMAKENQTTISGLPYGSSYNFKLTALENGTNRVINTVPFVLTTKPNCSEGEFQFGTACYWISKEKITSDEGGSICAIGNGEVVSPTNADEINFLKNIAQMIDTSFWINTDGTASLRQSPNIKSIDKVKREKRAASCGLISSENNQMVDEEQCGKRFPVLCKRKLNITMGSMSQLSVKDLTSTAITLRWDCNTWKFSNYHPTIESVPNPQLRTKRDTTSLNNPAISISNNTAAFSGLQPGTEYKINITPSMDLSDPEPRTLQGSTYSINVVTLDPNSTTPRAMAMTVNQLDATFSMGNGSVTGDANSVRNEQLFVFRIISCGTMIGLITITLLIFLASGMAKYRDCLCEICFELSLLVAHILILVDVHTVNQLDCKMTAMCIHYFFTASFLFFAMECFCYVKTMTKFVPINFLCHGWQFFIIGWGVPIVIVIISSTTIGDSYVLKETDHYCWLNLSGDAMLATVIPIGIFACVALVCLCCAICGRPDENYEVDEESFTRYEPMQDLRWILLLVFALFVCDWAVGMVGTHYQDGNLYIGFIVLNIVLGIVLMMLRCIGDDEVRLRIRTCCKSPSIEPNKSELGRYLSSHGSLRHRKSMFHSAGPEADGKLIIKRTYIYRP